MLRNFSFYIIDFVLVSIFSFIGYRNHHDELILKDIWSTTWMFLVGMTLGWAITYLINLISSHDYHDPNFQPENLFPAGLIIWAGTIIFGMIIRYFFNFNVSFSFIVVASIFTALFLFSWRIIYMKVGK